MTVIHKEYLVDSSGTDHLLCGMRREPSSRYTRWWTTVSCKNCLKKRKVRKPVCPPNRETPQGTPPPYLAREHSHFKKFYLWLAAAVQN